MTASSDSRPTGPVLAIDSSTRGGSVAVGIGGRVVAARTLPPGPGASATLMPAVDDAVREAGLSARELGAVAIGGGPGSFTGLRVAAAAAKGIVRALGVPLYAYSGLLAAAAIRRDPSRTVCGLFDARNREVYAGGWRFGGDGVTEVLAIDAMSIEALLSSFDRADSTPLFVGEGAALYRADIVARFGVESVPEEAGSELVAAGLVWLVGAAPELGRVDGAAAWEPEYVRASGAERTAAAGRAE